MFGREMVTEVVPDMGLEGFDILLGGLVEDDESSDGLAISVIGDTYD